jgi:hypothetical protein
MFRRSAIEHVGGFDPGVRIVEDHDLYLRLAREFPIYCHNQVVADYRQHEQNMSRLSMAATLEAVLGAMDTQQRWLAQAKAAARAGRRHWRGIFGPHLAAEFASSLKRGRFRQATRALFALVRHYPSGGFLYLHQRLAAALSRLPSLSAARQEAQRDPAPPVA